MSYKFENVFSFLSIIAKLKSNEPVLMTIIYYEYEIVYIHI